MFRLFRKLEEGEFLVAGGDCSQGGADANCCQFISKTKIDVPLVFQAQGTASTMTPQLHTALERIHDETHVPPVIALERNMGGASEMERLQTLNRNGKYKLFTMPHVGQTQSVESVRLGYSTTAETRPTLVGDLKAALDTKTLTLYDEPTIRELRTFILNKTGKPEAAPNAHDDLVMSLAIAWQLFQQVGTPPRIEQIYQSLHQHEEIFSDGGWY